MTPIAADRTTARLAQSIQIGGVDKLHLLRSQKARMVHIAGKTMVNSALIMVNNGE